MRVFLYDDSEQRESPKAPSPKRGSSRPTDRDSHDGIDAESKAAPHDKSLAEPGELKLLPAEKRKGSENGDVRVW